MHASMTEILNENSTHPKETGPERVAVVIPFYNQIVKLRATAESLIAQDFRPATVIFVDDRGEERMAPDILRSMEDAGIEALLVVNDKNMGPGRSRQAGLSKVPPGTDYVLFLDSDDHLSKGFLSSSVRMHTLRPDIIATYADSVDIHTGDSRVGVAPFPENLLDGILKARPWGTGALLWKYPQIRGLEWVGWKNVEDTRFELSAAMVNPRVAFVPDAFLYIDQEITPERSKVRNRGSNRRENFLNRSRIFEAVLGDFPFDSHGVDPHQYTKLAAYYLSYFYLGNPASYLGRTASMAARGRLLSALHMAYRFPGYLMNRIRHRRNGDLPGRHS
jgi:glycosyltransferase involved in cell wall biosynthesis